MDLMLNENLIKHNVLELAENHTAHEK